MISENVISHSFPIISKEKLEVNIIFYEEDAFDINLYDDDPLVITVQHGNLDIRHVLIDPISSADVLFWDAYQKR